MFVICWFACLVIGGLHFHQGWVKLAHTHPDCPLDTSGTRSFSPADLQGLRYKYFQSFDELMHALENRFRRGSNRSLPFRKPLQATLELISGPIDPKAFSWEQIEAFSRTDAVCPAGSFHSAQGGVPSCRAPLPDVPEVIWESCPYARLRGFLLFWRNTHGWERFSLRFRRAPEKFCRARSRHAPQRSAGNAPRSKPQATPLAHGS